MPASSPPPESRFLRSTDGRVLGGVCRGLSVRLGVSVWLLRFAFGSFALLDGAGVLIYAALWLFMPLNVGGNVGESGRRADIHCALSSARIATKALPVLGAALLIGVEGNRTSEEWNVAAPFAAVAVGLAVLWRQADDYQRARWFAVRDRPGPLDVARAAVGVLVVLGGVVWLLADGSSWAQTDRALQAALAVLAGAALIVAPFLLRIVRELAVERAERIRVQERSEMAALMHDSVLQTLSLIQHKSDDPSEMARLAHAQERDLRAWLYGGQPYGGDAPAQTFAQAIKAVAAEVEDQHGVEFDVVTVGDTELDDPLRACVAATREAAVNAAKYADGAPISIYAEIDADGDRTMRIYVRDRGPGFDPEAVGEDRMGIRESIIGRTIRCGGRATVESAAGQGTEVRLELTRV
ncbi:MAG TPA: PspC domain-containing protein [Actinocrinis sp.]